MAYQLKEINQAIRSDVQGFVNHCDELYQSRISAAVDVVMGNMNNSHIVLLSGPSGSGKTTTALKIEQELKRRGIGSHTVSMDNYFSTLTPETAPRNDKGDIDYESPNYMDMELLHEHFGRLEGGEEVHIPKFDFAHQRRSDTIGYPLRLQQNEVAIFEGIHALNDEITGRHKEASGLYISTRSSINDGDDLVFKASWLRLIRRAVRDHQFRGTGIGQTLRMWENVRRGEKLYILPFEDRAKFKIDATFPYEVSVMKNLAKPLFEAVLREVPEDNPRREELVGVINAFSAFETIDPALVREEALLREFIGGGTYVYK